MKKILIIGFGSIGARHFRIVKEYFPDSSIMVFRKSNKDLNCSAQFTNNFDEAIAFNPEIAIIACPATFHIKYARALLLNGCHLLIEKPIAASFFDVRDFKNLIKNSKLCCQVGYNLRHSNAFKKFKNFIIEEKLVGEILYVKSVFGQYLPTWREHIDYRKSVSAKKSLGGGILLEISHEIDYLIWLIGDFKWVSAWTGKLSDLEVDVEDTAKITCGFNRHSNIKKVVGTISLDFIRQDRARYCEVIGTKGTIKLDAVDNKIFLKDVNNEEWNQIYKSNESRDDSYRNQLSYFLDSIRYEKFNTDSFDNSIKVLEVIEAIKISAKEQCRSIPVNN